MHRRMLFLCAAVLSAAGSIQTAGQTLRADPDNLVPPDPLSPAEAVRLALARNPDLLALRKGKAVAEASISRAALLPDPELKFSYSNFLTDLPDTASLRNNVGLRWSPPRIGEIGIKVNTARSASRAYSDSVSVAEQKLAAEIRVMYNSVCLLDEQVHIAEENVRLRERILNVVVTQAREGVKSELERSLAELGLADSRPIVERYRAERRLQMVQLAAKLDLPPSYSPGLVKPRNLLAYSAPTTRRETVLAHAIETRSEVDAAAARCNGTELALKNANRNRLPWFSYVEVDRRFRRGGDSSAWGFQFGVDLPVFRWSSAAIGVAAAEVDQCRSQEQAVKASIVAEVDQVLSRLDSTAKDLAQYEGGITASTERYAEVARGMLAAGQSDAVEPLLAQVRLLSVRQTYVARLMELRALEVGLDQAVGDAIK